MAFHEVRFPADISFGSTGGPEYSTEIVVLASGHEQRNMNWSSARARYNVAHGVKNQAQLDNLISFFRARKGRAHGFRFKDWGDFSVAGGQLGVGNGSTQTFQAVKLYNSGPTTETRNITKLVSGSVVIYLDGVMQSSGYSVNYSTGIISFTSPPANSVVITADFEFDVPVRFDTDRLSMSLDSYGYGSWGDVPIVEVRG